MATEIALLVEAVHFAAEKHRMQKRKDVEETPYINHPIGVARILSCEAGITDLAVLQSALLHDTVEDTDTSFQEIEEKFGQDVRKIVEEVTDDKTLPKMVRKRKQIEQAPYCSHKAKLVKLADKLYNLRDLNRSTPKRWSEKRVQEYFHWAFQVVQGLQGASRRTIPVPLLASKTGVKCKGVKYPTQVASRVCAGRVAQSESSIPCSSL